MCQPIIIFHRFIKLLTQFGTIVMCFIAEVSTVIVTITGPMPWDTPAHGTSELVIKARVNTAHFITLVPAVIIWKETLKASKSYFERRFFFLHLYHMQNLLMILEKERSIHVQHFL